MSQPAPQPLPLRTSWVLGHRVTMIPCGDSYYLMDIVTPPGVPGPPPHYHTDAAEMFYVMDGALEVRCGDTWTRLEAGETLDVPVGEVHTFRNPTDGDVRWVTGWNPLGFQRFFAELGVDASEPDARARSVSEERIARVVAECGRFGMVIADG